MEKSKSKTSTPEFEFRTCPRGTSYHTSSQAFLEQQHFLFLINKTLKLISCFHIISVDCKYSGQ